MGVLNVIRCGDKGVLKRKHIQLSSVVHIGKESNNLDVSEIIGIQKGDQLVYHSGTEFWAEHRKKMLSAKPKDAPFLAIYGYDSLPRSVPLIQDI